MTVTVADVLHLLNTKKDNMIRWMILKFMWINGHTTGRGSCLFEVKKDVRCVAHSVTTTMTSTTGGK